MRTRRMTTVAALACGILVLTPLAAQAHADDETASVRATIAPLPTTQPDRYRTVDGKQEPVYEVNVGDTLEIYTRLANDGEERYWAFRGDFITLGADVFETPGVAEWDSGIGDGTWGTAVGVPAYELDPDRTHPYTRRTMLLNEYAEPGQSARLKWPIVVDALPEPDTYYPVRFRYDGSVSDPELFDSVRSQRIWLVLAD